MKILWAALIGLVVLGTPLKAQEEPALKVDVMFVGAHPDDDSMATATLIGFSPRVAVVCATRGEGGGNAIGRERGPALGLVREAEQRAALKRLGISSVSYLDCQDFGFTLSAEAAEKDWGHQKNLEKLVRMVRTMQPEILFTTHPGVGHGHHRFVARLATEAFLLASDPNFCPDQIEQEGLALWQPRKLFYAADEMNVAEREGAVDLQVFADLPTLQAEAEALREYRSQGWATNLPTQPETEPFVTGIDLVGGDLRHWPEVGLRLVKSPSRITVGQPFTLTLQPFVWGKRPKEAPRIEAPQGWSVKEISTPQEPLRFQVTPQGAAGVQEVKASWGEARVRTPLLVEMARQVDLVPPIPVDPFPDWAKRYGLEHLVRSNRLTYVVGLGETIGISAQVGNVRQTEDVRGERLGRSSVFAHGEKVELAVVPTATLPFEGRIADTDVWEGSVNGASDLSARFGMRTESDLLELWVEVDDDVVVANIAADDNRSHWRTDSVEIAFDPKGPGASAHTLDTVKVGIIPFNREGQVMAARTADANPGPVSRTLPNFQVQSRRTVQGYRLEIRVPFRDLGLVSGQPFGFNLIVYDADKADAAPGENANQARIAWSPWPLVQGDPRFWGRVRWTREGVLEHTTER